MTKDAEQAADNYAYDLHASMGPLPSLNHRELCGIFLAGVQWRNKNASAEVLALVDAVRDWLGRSYGAGEKKQRMRDALAAFKSRGS